MNSKRQISQLKKRGLIINNSNFACNILDNNNYYNIINAFKAPFLKSNNPEQYILNTTFEEIFAMYVFDVDLRNLFLKYILKTENTFKTYLSHIISIDYNPSPYFSEIIYDSKKINDVKKFQKILFELYQKNIENPMMCHFINRGEMVPLWAFVNVFDFGKTRTFYNYLIRKLKQKISAKYKLSSNVLYTFLSAINLYRNICAHNNRLYNYKIIAYRMQLSNTKIHANLNIEETILVDGSKQYNKGKRDLFAIVIAFKYMLNDRDFKSFYNHLNNIINHLSSKLKVISIDKILDDMGFPLDNGKGQKPWTDILTVSKF